ncbi:MAG: site-specific DNA-methyltransferase [Syntrophomonadaceae bacterium]|nr:site-specific DNA-methyltransferase [Syntrophomonadaceae bacterium]
MESEKSGVKLCWNSKGINLPLPDQLMLQKQQVNPCTMSLNNVFIPAQTDYSPQNRILQGNNLSIIPNLIKQGLDAKFDLIYLDPPYLSNAVYKSKILIGQGEESQWLERQIFNDLGSENMEDYLNELLTLFNMIKILLSDEGSLFVHLDWHSSHYVKILLDEVFGRQQFINEIVWCYSGGSGSRNHFHRKHDLILWYSKTDQYIFNPQYRPYSEATMQRGLTKVKGDRYKLKEQGALLNDWWTDIGKILSPTAYENLKFPTQKPIMLLERLVATASHPGGLVGDFYCGSGTTAQVCHQMGRKYIVCDNNPIAIQTCMQRMLRIKADPFFLFSALPETCNQLEIGPVQIVPHNEEYDRVDIILLNYKPAPVNQNENKLHFTAYIDFWEVGYENEQDTFVSIVQILRSNRSFDYSLPTVASLLMTANIPSLKVKVRDVFGSTAECDVL